MLRYYTKISLLYHHYVCTLYKLVDLLCRALVSVPYEEMCTMTNCKKRLPYEGLAKYRALR